MQTMDAANFSEVHVQCIWYLIWYWQLFLLSKIFFWRNLLLCLLQWSRLLTKEIKGAASFALSRLKIVKRLMTNHYQVIIDKTIVLCLFLLQPCTYLSYNVALWLTSHSPENDTIAHDRKLKNESIHAI